MKNDQYQANRGFGAVSKGDYVVGCNFLQQANVHVDLWRVGDFASDNLEATLLSYHTLQKVGHGIDDAIVVRLVSNLCALLILFSMMTLHFHAVNCKLMPPKHGC